MHRPNNLRSDVKLAFIGGTGVYQGEQLTKIDEVDLTTPWGKPSAPIMIYDYQGTNVAFLARHGKNHEILPTEIPAQANICALKWLGVERIISFSAVGSLKEEIRPRDYILPASVIDRTFLRQQSFFENGLVGHVSFGDAFCGQLAKWVGSLPLFQKEVKLHLDETLICMEGPAFSTRAESKLYKSWGAGIINMSVIPEAKLAREAEICYQMICMSTDYDSWREGEHAVEVNEIMAVVGDNSKNAQKLMSQVLENLNQLSKRDCSCGQAAKFAFITAPAARKPEVVEKLRDIYPNYLK